MKYLSRYIMRSLILLGMFLVVFPIGATNSQQVGRLQGNFTPEIHIRTGINPNTHSEWLKMFTYNWYVNTLSPVVVAQCTCLEDDLFFDDYLAVIRTVGRSLDSSIDNVRNICSNAFGNIFAEIIVTECYHQVVFTNSADRPILTRVY